MARKRKKSYSRGGAATNIMGTAIGVGGYIMYEALLEPKVAATIGNGLMLNVAELAVGLWMSKKGGVIGNIGKAAVVINTYQIVKPLLGGITA